ncbi:MAG TPA: DUF1615 domain-containing protein [Accumulibacter sp.]|nr:DUF1615 domain-containing protein [Accumulibacter sp.]HQC79085.1 DUF1615 domain-containing protein [Accumulibacter sp.]
MVKLKLILLTAVVAGCASDGAYESRPVPAPQRPIPPVTAPPSLPTPTPPPQTVRPLPPPAVPVPPTPTPAPNPGEREGRELILRLLPAGIGNRAAWATDIHTAFAALRLRLLPENLCATMAIIEQESTWQADPPVSGLSRIVWQEIERRRKKYGVPKIVLDLALQKSSPDGRGYKARIDALRTENQVNILYDDMISELPLGKLLLSGYNPVRTGGPMQVGVDFAEEQIRQKPYPYQRPGSVRNEVFTRRGGVYFGTAFLLDYPTNYSQMLYRFADFNAGRYSSRNAAFQNAVSRLSGRALALDGDLLRYKDGVPTGENSDTLRAILTLRSRLGLGETEILRDLKLEKSIAFENSILYQRLYALIDATGERGSRELLPRIDLKSPKISRQLTTEWFARRVDGRYRACLARAL